MWASRRARQAGAALVEMAITILLFLLLVFGIIEISLALFTWVRATEGARDGARYVIVHDPVTSLSALSCPGGTPVVKTCSSGCSALMTTISRAAPFVAGSQVKVTYACSDAGDPGRPAELLIPEVTVEISGLSYPFAVPTLIGLGSSLSLPTVRTTRTGEDLFTEIGS